MKKLFKDFIFTNNVVITYTDDNNFDELTSGVLLKIYISLQYKRNIKIIANNNKVENFYQFNKYKINKKDTIIKLDSQKSSINIKNKWQEYSYQINAIALSIYLCRLLINNNYIIDKELISFYIILVYFSQADIKKNNNEYKEKYMKLLYMLLSTEQVSILFENTKVVYDKLLN